MSAQTTETSVTFSLQELMKLEQERIAEQEQERRRQAARRQQAEQEARELAERQEKERIEKEEATRRLQEQRSQQEALRLEALRQGLIEAERQKALEQSRLLQAEREREHQLRLEAVRQSSLTRTLRSALILVSVLSAILLGGGLTLFVGILGPRSDRRLEELTELSAQRERDNTQLKRRVESQAGTVDKLLEQVRAGEVERSVLTARLQEALKELSARGGKPTSHGSGVSVARPPPAPSTNCPPGSLDPLCPLVSK